VVRGERRLTYALAASLALHVIALLPPSWAVPIRHLAQPLHATLRSATNGNDEAADPSQATPSPPIRRLAAPASPAARASPPGAKHSSVRPEAPPALIAEVSDATVTRPPPALEPVSPETAAGRDPDRPDPLAAARGADRAPPPVALAPAAPQLHPAGAGEALDLDAMRAYRFALAQAVSRRYPRDAIERGLSGMAEIRVLVDRDGRTREVLLRRSSGHAVLDAEARSMVAGAASRAKVPPPLLGQEFSVDLAVRFDLRDAEAF
jgi:protein TonB